MRTLICDDEIHYANAIKESIERWKKKTGNVSITYDVFRSSEDMLDSLRNQTIYDLVFLDIQFPAELNGLQVAKQLRMLNDQVVIVFVSNYDEYAIDGYKVNALRFLTKPISDNQVFECLDIAYRQWQITSANAVIVLETKQQIHKISNNSIVYIESRTHYLDIHTLNIENDTITIRMKIGEILKDLPSDMFVQCHQSYIINLLYVQRLTRTRVTLTNNQETPMSIKYRDAVYKKFKQLYQGGIN